MMESLLALVTGLALGFALGTIFGIRLKPPKPPKPPQDCSNGHDWGKWSNPYPCQRSNFMGPWYDSSYQTRVCKRCYLEERK